MAGRTPLSAYPDGWFGIADSDALLPGQLRRLRYFGRELVLLRSRDGVAHLFDAYCPHLGAHLGVGGTIVDDTLRCPFHGWRFDGSGRCVEIPYAKRIPPGARLTPWRLDERHGVILAWHHARGEAPGWRVPELLEWDAPGWSAPVRRSFRVRVHCQEMAENVVDDAHFLYVHGTRGKPESQAEIDGPIFRAVQRTRIGTPRGETDGRIEIASYGLGCGTTRFTGVVETLLLVTGAPIDEEWSETTLRFRVKELGSADATQGVGRAFVAEIDRQFAQDIPIWEHKIHRTQPLLCDGDGPIPLLRRWARQFYSGPAPATR
jgi:3-ketosteroid 9alpha-monooxygenase subunit A